MVRFTLEQLTNDVATKPKLADRLFLFHASNDRYGHNAALALGVPESARNYAQNSAVATAQATFNGERRNPTVNDVLLQTYLPIYNQEMNREGWNRGKNIAVGMAGLGAAFLVWSFVADAETARKTGKVVSGLLEAGAAIKAVKEYVKYRL